MRLVVGILIVALGFNGAKAAEFHLRDGSVIIGTIVSLTDGDDLVVDTAHMDEVTIEWEAIEEIRGTQVVDVVTFDGRRFIGTVTFGEGNIAISGEDDVEVAPGDVFSIDEINDSFWEGLDAYTDLGMNVVRGNNRVTQLNFGAGVRYEGRDSEVSIDASSIINEQTETQDTRRNTFSAAYTYDFGPRWQGNAFYQFESDEQQGLDGRSLLGGFISNRLVNSRHQRFSIFGGFAVNSEKFDAQPRTETPEGLIGFGYRLRWAADIDATLTFFPNLEESDRLRTQFDGTMSFDLFSDLDFKVTVYNRYDSAPPPGNKKNDSGVTLALSWEY
jgi:putative salt-induced outer membrane protein YdiY